MNLAFRETIDTGLHRVGLPGLPLWRAVAGKGRLSYVYAF